MSGDTSSRNITSDSHAVLTKRFQGGYTQQIDTSCHAVYSTSQHTMILACSYPYKNFHSQSHLSLTQHIDTRVCNNNSRSVDDIVIRSRVKSKPLPGALYSLQHEIPHQLSPKVSWEWTGLLLDHLLSLIQDVNAPNYLRCHSILMQLPRLWGRHFMGMT